MPLSEKDERDGLGTPRSASENFVITSLRWREPCVKIIIIGNLLFATIISAQIGLSATLKPSVRVDESNGFQIAGQIKILCKAGQRTLLYGFDFFTISETPMSRRGLFVATSAVTNGYGSSQTRNSRNTIRNDAASVERETGSILLCLRAIAGRQSIAPSDNPSHHPDADGVNPALSEIEDKRIE